MRYLPLTDADRRAMLATIGVPSVDSLFRDVPASARLTAPVDLPNHLGEIEVERRIGALAAKNLGPNEGPWRYEENSVSVRWRLRNPSSP